MLEWLNWEESHKTDDGKYKFPPAGHYWKPQRTSAYTRMVDLLTDYAYNDGRAPTPEELNLLEKSILIPESFAKNLPPRKASNTCDLGSRKNIFKWPDTTSTIWGIRLRINTTTNNSTYTEAAMGQASIQMNPTQLSEVNCHFIFDVRDNRLRCL